MIHNNRLLLSASWLCTLWFTVTTALVMVAAYTAVPVDDEWLDRVQLSVSTLAAQFNEHFILTARLVLLADQEWFSYTRIFPLLVIMLVQVAHAWMLARLYRDSSNASGRFLALPLALCLLLCAYQWENFVWAFQIQFVLVGMAASMGFFLLASRPSGLTSATAAFFAATISAYSMINGLLALVLLISMAFCMGRPRREVIGLATAVLLLILVYWSNYQHYYTGEYMTSLWQKLPRLMGGVLNYLGLPLATLLPSTWELAPDWDIFHGNALLAGALAVVLFLLAGITVCLQRPSLRAAHWALWHIVLFVGISAVITSAGRSGDTFVSRYGTPVFVGWVAVLLLLDALWAASSAYRKCRPALVMLGIIVLLTAWSQPNYLQPALERARMMRGFETALLTQVDDHQRLAQMNAAFHWPTVKPILQHWKQQHMGVYAQPWAGWLGTPLQQHLVVVHDDSCSGTITNTAMFPVETGGTYNGAWRISGELKSTSPINGKILLLDDAGIIVGYGLSEYPNQPWQTQPDQQTWSGHVGLHHATRIHAFAWLENSSACFIGQSTPLDPVSAVQTVDDSSVDPQPLPMEAATAENWSTAMAVSAPYRPYSLPGLVFNTDPALKNAENTYGELHWRSLPIPMADTIVIPVFTGYYGQNLSVRVVDPDTGYLLLEVPDLATSSIGWRNWLLRIPQDGRATFRIEIQASDRSDLPSGSGHQWMAVTQPHQLQKK